MTKLWGQFNEVAALWPLFHEKTDGYYLDVGAHDGHVDSNTLKLASTGWKGICIEPHRTYYPRLVKNRPRAICLDVAAWSKDAEDLEFYATAPGGWSRVGSKGAIAVSAIYSVRGRTLDGILEEYKAPEPIDLFSLDVEGTEEEVLKGFNLKRWKPRIAIVEDLSLRGQFDELFSEEGYEVVHSWDVGRGGSNCIYCRDPGELEIVKEGWRIK